METKPIFQNPYNDNTFTSESPDYFAHFKNLPPLQKNEFEWRIPNFIQLRNSVKTKKSWYFVVEEGVARFELELWPNGNSVEKEGVSLYLNMNGYDKTHFPNTKYSLSIVNYVDWRNTEFFKSTHTFTGTERGLHKFLTYEKVQSGEFWSPSGEMLIRARVQYIAIDDNPYKDFTITSESPNYFADFENLPPLQKNEFEWRIPNFIQLRNSNDHQKYKESLCFVVEENVSRLFLRLWPCGSSDVENKSVGLFFFMKGYGDTNFPNTKFSLAIVNNSDWRKTKFYDSIFTFTGSEGRGSDNFLTYEEVKSKEFFSPTGEMLIRARVQFDMHTTLKRLALRDHNNLMSHLKRAEEDLKKTNVQIRTGVEAKHVADKDNTILKNKLNKALKQLEEKSETEKKDITLLKNQINKMGEDHEKTRKELREKSETEIGNQQLISQLINELEEKSETEKEITLLKNTINKMGEDHEKTRKELQEKSETEQADRQFFSHLLKELEDLKIQAKDEKPDTEGHKQRLQEMALIYNNIVFKLQERVKHEEEREERTTQEPTHI